MFARRTLLQGAIGLPLAAVLADPKLARAAAAGLEIVALTTPGGQNVRAALAMPNSTPASAVLLVHEWWGLNDQIKSVAAELANQGYIGLAVDLYDGNVATTPGAARGYMGQVKPAEATVVYYGNVAKSAQQLAPLKGPVLGHFATRDGWINRPMVDGFAQAMRQAGKQLQAHWYEADHAFANPTSARYDAADAKLAWQRTLAFLKQHI